MRLNKIVGILGVSLLLTTATYAKSEDMIVNGKDVVVETYEDQGNKLIPLRKIGELLDLNTSYDKSTKTIVVSANQGNKRLDMVLGQKLGLVDLDYNNRVSMPAVPRLIDGVAYVPLRFVADTFSCTVEYKNNKVCITQNVDSRYGFEGYQESEFVKNNQSSKEDPLLNDYVLVGDIKIFNPNNLKDARFLYTAAQHAVKSILRDPVSAQFDTTGMPKIFSIDDSDVCISGSIRATNAYGAYKVSNYDVVFYDADWTHYAIWLDGELISTNKF